MADELDPFELDPGRPPAEGDERQADEPDEPSAPAGRDEKPAVGEDDVAELFDFAGSLLNALATARGGGPDDVYTFTAKELELLGRAGASYVNRHARLAAIAEKSDVVIIGGVTVKMLKRETGRLRAFRAAQAEGAHDLDRESPRFAGGVIPVEPQ